MAKICQMKCDHLNYANPGKINKKYYVCEYLAASFVFDWSKKTPFDQKAYSICNNLKSVCIVFVCFIILISCFVCRRSGGFPVIWLSEFRLDVDVIWARAQPESMSALFGHFWDSGIFIVTDFTSRFWKFPAVASFA